MRHILLCTALMVFSSMASAVVYKWVDAQGNVQYGDRPPDGVHAEVMELIGPHPVSRPSPPAAPPKPAATMASNPAPVDDKTKKAVAADVDAVREKQCTDAQERYRQLIEGRRLYRVGADGEREYLTSEEIDAARLSAKQEVDTFCNAQG